MNDREAMQRALHLAESGRGFVEPNPLVGAVVVRDGVVIGEGWHQRFGEAHAEVNAFRNTENANGATLYVTLEPCCHFGKTPPCTDAVIASGVRRVVVAMADPFPKVAGQGLQILRDAGIEVEVGLCEAESRRLNAPYLTLVGKSRPHIHAKWAMTLDGKIASHTGHSQWISGETSRETVHRLRGQMDAIIVGGGTLRSDDPLLTARPVGARRAVRIVVTESGDIPRECQLLRTLDQGPVMFVTANRATPHLSEPGAEVLVADIPGLLEELGRRRMTNVLIEGGAGLLGAFRDLGLIDEVHVFIAPKLVGGDNALSPMAGVGAATIGEGLKLSQWECNASGEDWYVRGW